MEGSHNAAAQRLVQGFRPDAADGPVLRRERVGAVGLAPHARANGRALRGLYARHRFGVLFAALFLALVCHPVLSLVTPREDAIEWLLALSLGAAVLGVERDRGIGPLLVLAGAFASARLAAGVLQSPALFGIGQVLWALACLLATILLVRHALRPGPVDSERVFAALDAYLLAAATFGVVYWLLDRIVPASIGPDLTGSLAASDALYLSLATISTLGFGDLVPVTPVARAFVTMEAIGGQMYLTVLIARLVSLYAASARESGPVPDAGSRAGGTDAASADGHAVAAPQTARRSG